MSKKQNRKQVNDQTIEELSDGIEPTTDQKKELERKSNPLKFGFGDILKAHLEKGKGNG